MIMLELQSPEQGRLAAGGGHARPPLPALAWHPWLHAWALLTLTATFVALGTGSLVTTLQVGMVEQVWPTSPWHLAMISWTEPSAGYLIEHSHRLADYVVGVMVIGLAAGLWFIDGRNWVRVFGVVALLGWCRRAYWAACAYWEIFGGARSCALPTAVALLWSSR